MVVRRKLTACDGVFKNLTSNSLTTSNVNANLITSNVLEVKDLMLVNDLEVQGNLVACAGSPLGSLLVSDGEGLMSKKTGDFLTYTGEGSGVMWSP